MKMLKLAAAAAIVGAAGLGAAAAAHSHPDGDGEGKKVRQILILEGEGKEKLEKGRAHAFRIERGELLAKCAGEKTEIDETSGDGEKQRTRIVICDKGSADPAARAEQLEKAIERIDGNDEMSAEHRERVTTALREAIGRLRATD